MFIAAILAVIILAVLVLDSLPGTSHAVFDPEIGLSPRRAWIEAADLPGGHVGPAGRDCSRRPFALRKVSPINVER